MGKAFIESSINTIFPDPHTLLLLTGEDFKDRSKYNSTITNYNSYASIAEISQLGSELTKAFLCTSAANRGLLIRNTANTSLFTFSTTRDLTIEFWFYQTGTGASQNVFSLGDYSTNCGWHHDVGTPTNSWGFYSKNTSMVATGITATTNTWHYYTAVKSGPTLTWFIDGVRKNSYTYEYTLGDAANQFNFGCEYSRCFGETSWSGYMCNLRISDIVRYTSDFIPSKAKFRR